VPRPLSHRSESRCGVTARIAEQSADNGAENPASTNATVTLDGEHAGTGSYDLAVPNAIAFQTRYEASVAAGASNRPARLKSDEGFATSDPIFTPLLSGSVP
jgi:hypothetical protein